MNRAPLTGSLTELRAPDAGGGGAPARIFINGRFLTQRVEGVQRAADEIVHALDALLAEGAIDPARWRVTVLTPRAALRPVSLRHLVVQRVGWLRGHPWEQLELPWYSRGGVLLSLCNAAPLLKRKHVATLYDAAVFAAPAGYSRVFSTWYRILFAGLGRTARTVLTLSDFSRRELSRYARVPAHKLRVVPFGAHHLQRIEADASVLDRYGLRGERFVLAVGSLNPNKNFRAVLDAVRSLPPPRPKLVVAGGANERVFRDGTEVPTGGSATYVGYVTDAQLKALYGEAAGFVFPSLYEGLGFPPLEAMTCGCPVLVSDIPVLREVCGDAAAYFDPRDPRDLGRAICRLLEDEGFARDLRARGLRRIRSLSWERCAREVWAAVRGVAEG